MRDINIRLITFLILLGSGIAGAQTSNRNEMEEQAYMYYNAGDYANAYVLFDKLNAKYPKEYEYRMKLGLCCLYYPEKNARSIEVFRSLQSDFKGPVSDYHLGKAYQVNYRFDEALAILEPLVAALSESKKEEDKALVADAILGIANCKNGKYLVQNKVFADITNIGPPINTSETEAVPIINADESMMIFTYSGTKSLGGKVNESLKPDPNGKYGLDIYKSLRKTDGSWGVPEPINNLNTNANDAAIALSPDGTNLFIFYSDNKNPGDIHVSHLNNNEFSRSEPLNANINTPDYWEGSCSISADGRFLYFASERPGGQGGRDIWVSEFVNGDWGPAVNLGPKVNTVYDEDAPFIHPDGITLFFSSKGHLSIGGYDIMFSIKEDNGWSETKSMGIPLNTTGDDNFYVINSKGDRGYFSSYRAGAGGLGEKDIYSVTPGILGEKPVVAVLKGVVYGNDKPIGATIDVNKSTAGSVGPFSADKSTGKYLMAFSPGAIYTIRVSAEGFVGMEEKVDLQGLTSYLEKTLDFHLSNSSAANTSTDAVAATKEPATATISVSTEEKPKTTEETSSAKDPVNTNTSTTSPTETKNNEAKDNEVKGNEAKDQKTGKTPKTPKAPKTPKTPKEKQAGEGATTELPGTSGNCNERLPDFGPLKSKSLNDPSYYSQLLALAGNYCSKGLVFKVQVGAYRMPDDFNKHNKLKNLGKIESEKYPDGITRFTQKEFRTLNEAEKHRQKVIAKGQTDAWIVAVKDGKRYTLEDLIMIDFLGQTIN